jgi:cell division transport system permease protein
MKKRGNTYLPEIAKFIRSGFQIFRRNLPLFGATIAVMAMMLLVFAGLFTFRFFALKVLAAIQERIAISVYFDATVDESGILRARDLLTQLPEVERVDYVSREEALARFKERHKTNAALLQAIEEIGSNPLQASLNIKAKDSTQYASIASFLENAPFRNQIAKVNFVENQLVIERLNRIIAAGRNVGMALSLMLAAIAILVFSNTMRIAIYTFREEIAVMKLVGASNNFVRGPFAVAGILAGTLAALISSLLFVALMSAAAPKLEALVPGAGIGDFLASSAVLISGLQFVVGVALGMFSTTLATNKYLNV